MENCGLRITSQHARILVVDDHVGATYRDGPAIIGLMQEFSKKKRAEIERGCGTA